MLYKFFFSCKYRYISATIFFLAIIIMNNCFQEGGWGLFANYIDGFFVAGFANILIGGLAFVGNQGSFDIFSYIFAKRKENIKNLYDYSESKKEKRIKEKYCYVPYITVGVLSLLLSVILFIIFSVKY